MSDVTELRKRIEDAAAIVASWSPQKREAVEALLGPCRMCKEGIEHMHGAYDGERSSQ